MSTTIAIHWTEPTLPFVVVQAGQVTAVSEISLDIRQEPAVIGRQLSAALAPFVQGRVKLIVALSRDALQWQHLSLPPCPADELSDVVQLQSDRDYNFSDEDLGFDYLSLIGDERTPYQVLTVALDTSELTKIRQVCRAANLTLERVVPLAVGWPAVCQLASPGSEPDSHIFVAPLLLPAQANEATLWATRAGRVMLFRQFRLGDVADPAGLAAGIGSELRRTLLALPERSESAEPTIFMVGYQHDQLSELARLLHAELAVGLHAELEIGVQSLDITAPHPSMPADATTAASALPLAGLAIDESQGRRPLIDLLHPHRRPQAAAPVRTYALAATAGVLLVTLLGWFGYSKLQAPLHQAAADQAELTLLEESRESLQEYEQRAAAIRDWSAEAPNLLVHLQQVSQCLRPEALDAEGFSIDQDVVLEKLDLEKRALTIDALTRSSRTVQPLESRLREAGYRPQRGKSDPSQTVKEYPWHFQSTIEITYASDHAGEPDGETNGETSAREIPATDRDAGVATDVATEEPQS